ncbi:MAG TPA: hypothetical protein VMZ28_15215, partial [Kofleriaceae bacterium]|nr:hypothetical protein [Kofleriaceae bacterium]
MGLIRTGFRLGRRALLSGPGAGAFVLSLLFVTDLLGASLDFMGFSDEKATRYIIGRYGPHIILNQLEILAIYAVVGALFGALGDGIGRLWDWARMRSTSRTRRVLRGAGAAIVGHGFVLVRHLVHYPQLYTEWLYDRGGARRAVMVALTDHLSVLLLDLLAAAVLIALVGGPLAMRRGRTRIRHTFQRTPPSWAIAAGLVALSAATATWVGMRRH